MTDSRSAFSTVQDVLNGNTSGLPSVSVLFPLLALSALVVVTLVQSRHLRHVPGPVAAYLGSLHRLSLISDGKGSLRYRQLHEKYGSVVRTGWNHVLVSNPAYIARIYDFGGKFQKSGFYVAFSLFYKSEMLDTVFTVRDHPTHKKLALQIVTKHNAASTRSYEKSFDYCYDVFREMIEKSRGHAIDVGKTFKLWAFDANSVALFTRDFGFMKQQGDVDGLIAGINQGFRIGTILGQVPSFCANVLGNKYIMWFMRNVMGAQDPGQEIVKASEKMIHQLDSTLTDDDACIYTSLRQDVKLGKRGISQVDLINHVANLQVAGSVATASALTSVFYFLLHHEASRKRLTAEVVVGTRGLGAEEYISFDDAAALPYLQGVIMESLRLCPSNGLPLERIVPATGLVVDGVYLPPGTNVAICAPVVHRNATVYGAEVDKFRPERWVDADEATIAERKALFLGFGKGGRGCTGRQRAMMEMSKFIVETLRRYDIEWAGGDEPWQVKNYWMPEQSGVSVRFTPKAS